MKFLYALVLSTLLVGCASAPTYTIQQTQFKLTVIETSDFLSGNNPAIKGEAEIRPGECVIRLRKYPQCLLHEIRHCVEGNWHEGRNTTEDC